MPGSNADAFPLLRCLLRVGVGDVPQLRASETGSNAWIGG